MNIIFAWLQYESFKKVTQFYWNDVIYMVSWTKPATIVRAVLMCPITVMKFICRVILAKWGIVKLFSRHLLHHTVCLINLFLLAIFNQVKVYVNWFYIYIKYSFQPQYINSFIFKLQLLSSSQTLKLISHLLYKCCGYI